MNLRKTGILLAWAMIIAANGTAQNVQRTSQGIKYAAQGMNVSVEFYSPSIIRVYKTPGETASDKESLVVIKAPEQTPVSFGENGKNVTLSSQMIQVEVNPETGGIHFFDKLGQRLLTDKDYGTQFTPFNDAGVPSYNVRQAFLLDKDEVIYGLGQQQTGKVNQRNQKLFLRNQNMSICIPFIHSIKGYALYWDNYSPTTFLDNPQETSFDSEVGDCADYYFIYGGHSRSTRPDRTSPVVSSLDTGLLAMPRTLQKSGRTVRSRRQIPGAESSSGWNHPRLAILGLQRELELHEIPESPLHQ